MPFPKPLGQIALHRLLGLGIPEPQHQSFFDGPKRRPRELDGPQVREFFTAQAAPSGDLPLDHLRFALKREPLDAGILAAAFEQLDPRDLETWIRAEPTGEYSRRAFYLYETLTGKELDVEPLRLGNYAEALDVRRQYVGPRERSPRHRVDGNLLGIPAFCPTVRRTEAIERRSAEPWRQRAEGLLHQVEPRLLARAIDYLYTKETRASFDIERAEPSPSRAERFVAALRSAAGRDITAEAALVEVQGLIVEPRYAETGYREVQNWIGDARLDSERVYFIPPRPEHLPDLMEDWASLTRRLLAGDLDPVVAAAVISFSFVFLHPFGDGNGRLHRYLIHAVLAQRGFSPGEAIFPVSAAILRDLPGYDRVLESFSAPLMARTDWRLEAGHASLAASGNEERLYRYFDATAMVEFLYDKVADTVEQDLPDELRWLDIYDRASRQVRDVVDMPDRKVALFVKLCLDNQGRLAKRKRELFGELSEEEIAAMEAAVAEAMRPRS